MAAGSLPVLVRQLQGRVGVTGTAVLNGTTAVVVPAPAVSAASLVFLTIQTPGGTPGAPYVSATVPGVSFSVKSSAGDTSTVAWLLRSE